MYLGEDVIFDVVGVMLNKEAQQLEDKAENLNFRSLLGNNTKMSHDVFSCSMRQQGGVTMSQCLFMFKDSARREGFTCTVQLSVFSGDPAPVLESRGAMNTEIVVC